MAEDRDTSWVTAVVPRMALSVLAAFCLASGEWTAPLTAFAQQCAEDDECTVQYTCQDEVCKGTPKQDGTACRLEDPCGTFSCQNGQCVPNATSPPGTICLELEPPFQSWTCQEFPAPIYVICEPPPIDCDDGNACTVDFVVHPFEECSHIQIECNTDCSTAECNPQTGCVNRQPANEGGACDDGNVCNGTDHCQAGECVGGLISATPSLTPSTSTTGSPTATRSQTPTPSRTGTTGAAASPTATRTITPSPTTSTTPAGTPACGTDCTGDGKVTVDDVVRLVAGNCPAQPDPTQADLILAVSGVLDTCAEEEPTPTTTATQSATPSTTVSTTPSPSPVPATPTQSATGTATITASPSPSLTTTATPTRTASGTVSADPTITGTAAASPTVTDTPSTPIIPNVPERAAGTIEASNGVFLSISRIFGLVVGIGAGGGSGSSIASPQAPSAACEEGTLSAVPANLFDCLFANAAPVFEVTMTDCKVTGAGATLIGNGSLSITGSPGDDCLSIPQQSTLDVPSVTLEASASTGSTTLTVTDVTTQLTLLDPVQDCNYERFLLQQLQGTVGIVTRDAAQNEYSSAATFTNSDLEITVTQYNAACVPVVFTTTVNGGVEITAGNLTPFTGQFSPYVIADDASSGTDVINVSGVMNSVCLGGSAEFVTATPLLTTIGAPCPHGGAILVTLTGNTDRVTYTATGGVDIDEGNNGGEPDQHFNSCLELSPCSN
jgi:hypothetical protein